MKSMMRSTWLLVIAVGMSSAGCEHELVDLTPDAGGDGRTFLPPPPCGNGVLNVGEQCDDGNRMNDDSCSWDCRLGTGEPPGAADPSVRMVVPVAAPFPLGPIDRSPPAGARDSPLPLAVSPDVIVVSWRRVESEGDPGVDPGSTISTRFLRPDGTLVRPDVPIELPDVLDVVRFTNAIHGTEAALLWRVPEAGISMARLSTDVGLVGDPFPLPTYANGGSLAVAATTAGYVVSWYEGSDMFDCEHTDLDPNRIFLRPLGPDGAVDVTRAPIVLEDPNGSMSATGLASGDGTVGAIWWRASTERGGTCMLRFGVTDPGATGLSDGGTIGTGSAGRIVRVGDAYAVAWKLATPDLRIQLAFASFDDDARLLDAPVVYDLPAESFAGNVEVAAGDGGLLAVVPTMTDVGEPRFLYLRTDASGRAVAPIQEVNPGCTAETPNCWVIGHNVAWTGSEFVVLYLFTADASVESSAVEMRMIRLAPEG